MRLLFWTIVLLFYWLVGSTCCLGQFVRPTFGIDDTTDVIDHHRFDSLWNESVSHGKISTRGINSEAYVTYRLALKGAFPDAFLPDARFAFWVNAYLAGLYQLIHEAVGYRSTVWDSAFLARDTFDVARGRHTLRDMQDSILRVSRTVRAIAFFCTGSSTSPPFPNHVAFAKTVRRLMRDMMRRLCRSEKFLLYDPAGAVLQLSRFFQPYHAKMAFEATSVGQFVMPFLTEAVAAQLALRRENVNVVFSDRIETWRKAR